MRDLLPVCREVALAAYFHDDLESSEQSPALEEKTLKSRIAQV